MQDILDLDVQAFEADPYPFYARLRSEAPVCMVPALDVWLVSRYADVKRVASDPEAFPVDSRESPLTRTVGTTVMSLDGAPHERLRTAFDPAVESAMKGLEERIGTLTNEALERISARGSAELMGMVIVPVSVRVSTEALGLGSRPYEAAERWVRHLTDAAFADEEEPSTRAAADAVSQEIQLLVDDLLAHDAAPRGSVLDSLARAGLSPPELVAHLKIPLLDPSSFVGLVLWSLLAHPTEFARTRAEPSLLSPGIEEALRWQSPEGAQFRISRHPTEVGGVPIPAGASVAAVIASANRDEETFAEPDRFDLDRKDRHAAFGFGPHSCPGHHFARVQIRTMIERISAGLPNLRLDPQRKSEVSGWAARGPTSLYVCWDT